MKWYLRRHVALWCSFLWIFSAVAAESTPSVEPAAFRMPPGNTKFENVTFVVFDTETTGFSPEKDRLVEIGAVKIRKGEVLDSKTWLINPQRYIPKYAQDVHHITPAMVKDAPIFEEVYPDFLEFIDGAVLVAHNASFDVRFIVASANRAGLPPPNNICVDSLALFRRWHPQLKSHKVDDLVELFDMDIGGAQRHRAEDDSIMVYMAMQAEMLQRSDSPRFRDLLNDAGGYYKFVDPVTLERR